MVVFVTNPLATASVCLHRGYGGISDTSSPLRAEDFMMLLPAPSGPSRPWIAREIQTSSLQLFVWAVGALKFANSILGSDSVAAEPKRDRLRDGFVIVDRSLTRC
jgi:hypothetical protein